MCIYICQHIDYVFLCQACMLNRESIGVPTAEICLKRSVEIGVEQQQTHKQNYFYALSFDNFTTTVCSVVWNKKKTRKIYLFTVIVDLKWHAIEDKWL